MSAIPSFGSNIGADLGAAGSVAGAIGGLIGAEGTASADTAAAQGYTTEASYYGQAADLAAENVTIAQANTQLQQYASNRALTQTQAQVKASTASNGLELGGSDEYILRSNAAQGGLASALIGQQGALTENGYATQEYALKGEQGSAEAAAAAAKSAAGSAGIGGIFGSLAGAAGGIAKLFAL